MADALDIEAMLQRFRDRSVAVKRRNLPPVAGPVVKAASGMEQLPPMARETVRSAVTASQVG